MEANIIYPDFNPCGGGERLALATIQAISEMGLDLDITTYTQPDLSKLENAYGKSLTSVMRKVRKVNVVSSFDEHNIKRSIRRERYDININTHVDLLPYYQDYFSKKNAVAYCHFPMAKQYIESRNLQYLKRDLRIIKDQEQENTLSNNDTGSRNKEKYFQMIKYFYDNLMKNSTVITNSEFSRKAIFEAFDNDEIDEVQVLSPPVDVDTFRRVLLSSPTNKREDDIILVVSRIDKQKKIENAIRLAKLLKQNNIGSGMKIIGNIDYKYDLNYYLSLNQMVIDFDLEDYVTLETDVCLNNILSIMREAKVYFHPMIGEHFGISIVEAMAAGLVPIVPDVGGPTEFVPKKYHFHTFEEAVKIISTAFNTAYTERVQISNSVSKFSISNYIEGFQKIVNELLPCI
ncbi:MAG TPA: glycosyltransferase [Nitrososphaeraceae archaeon]|nr:glycosyltransferase [Nitrososphaeraceae archaeon]